MSSIATQIPSELLKHILNCFWPDTGESNKDVERDHAILSNRQLSQCALVCRYWGQVCQSIVFQRIRLRSKQDFQDLLDMAASPHSSIIRYVEGLRLLYTISSVPWLHLVSLKCRQVFPHYSWATVTMKGPQALKHLHRGIHASLPRSVQAFSEDITSVYLVDIEFDKIRDVYWLATELPSLNILSCEKLSWIAAPSGESDLRILYGRCARCRSMRMECKMIQCSEPWAAFALCHALRREPERLSFEDFLTVSMLIRVVMSGKHGLPLDTVEAWMGEDDIHIFCSQHGGRQVILIYLTTVQEGEVLKIEKIELNLVTEEELPTHFLRGFPWEQFDEFATKFDMLQRVTVELGSRDHFLPFVETAIPRLSRLDSAEKMRYKIQVGPEMPSLKGTQNEIESQLRRLDKGKARMIL